jgi:hypothetical protein
MNQVARQENAYRYEPRDDADRGPAPAPLDRRSSPSTPAAASGRQDPVTARPR